ncbi:MAG: hypothetical protein ACFFFG_18290 [Candidatus Thorarchaeota archaeon]
MVITKTIFLNFILVKIIPKLALRILYTDLVSQGNILAYIDHSFSSNGDTYRDFVSLVHHRSSGFFALVSPTLNAIYIVFSPVFLTAFLTGSDEAEITFL